MYYQYILVMDKLDSAVQIEIKIEAVVFWFFACGYSEMTCVCVLQIKGCV